MPYSAERIMHDADSHIMETRDWLAPYLDEQAPIAMRSLYGKERSPVDDLLKKAKSRQHDAAAEEKAATDPIAGPKGWMAYGAFDSGERSKALDTLGFKRQLVFSTASIGPLQRAKTEQDLYQGVRAHNLAMSQFCASDPRLQGVAYVPLDNVERAVEEARFAIEQGCKAVQVFAGPSGGRSPGHTDIDPFWQLLSDSNIPFMLHIGPGTITQQRDYHNNGRKRAPDLHGGGENLRFPDYAMLAYAPQNYLIALIYDGVFERFPLLRGGVIESGAAWVPGFLDQVDFAYKGFRKTDPYLGELTMKPSDYIRRAIKFTPFPGEDAGKIIRDGGADLFMFSSDYPHPEGTNDPLGRFEHYLDELSEADKDKFYRANYETMMGL